MSAHLLDVRLVRTRTGYVVVRVDGKPVNTTGNDPMTTALRCLARAWSAEPPASREDSMEMAAKFLAKLRGEA